MEKHIQLPLTEELAKHCMPEIPYIFPEPSIPPVTQATRECVKRSQEEKNPV